MREYPSDETPYMITPYMIKDILLPEVTAQDQQIPTQAIETQFPSMDQEEEGSFRQRPIRRTRSPVYKEEDTTIPDSHAGSDAVSERYTNHGTQPSPNTHQSSPGSCIVSPDSSLYRAHTRALTITGASGFSRLKQTEDDGNQGIYGDECSNVDGRQDFRRYQSPFSRRVKEKLRAAHVYDHGPPGESSNQAVDLPTWTEDAERNRQPEILSADLTPFVAL
jgi:hypothetical protein